MFAAAGNLFMATCLGLALEDTFLSEMVVGMLVVSGLEELIYSCMVPFKTREWCVLKTTLRIVYA